MSWTLFNTKCMVLTGNPHTTTEQFAWTIADAYHQAVTLHFETMTGGGKIINNAPKLPILYQGILAVCKANSATHAPVQFTQQIGVHIQQYHVGGIITGPLGIVNVLSPGVWVGVPVVQNTNFSIMLNALIMSFRTHIMTLVGTYTSSVVPGVITPFSGATLISLG
jgi:hypothetical protein